MAYQLKMATIEAILALKARGWSNRRIALELDVHRETVARQLRLAEQSKPAKAPTGSGEASADSKPAKAPTGSEPANDDSKPAKAPTGSVASPEAGDPPDAEPTPAAPPTSRSLCAPFCAVILAKLEQDLSAQRIFQDLSQEHGFTGKYHAVRRFVRRLRKVHALPYRRLECGPGEECQVDFGSGAPIVTPEGKRRRPHVFRIVLSYSRKAYSEVVLRQTTEEFLGCLENAFRYFGGVPRVCVIDNLKAAVTQADWYDPELHPKMGSFGAHYGTTILPTRPRTPEHKGKVEKGVAYVQDNALKGRVFPGLSEENAYLLDWETTVADTRIHGTTRKQVGKVFAEEERAALQPLPIAAFPWFHEGERLVHRDGHVEVAKAYYSVPPEYLGRRVWVRWDGRLVRIYNERLEQLAVHAQQEAGRFSTQRCHIVPEKISGIERGVDWLLSRIQRIGAHAVCWAQAVVEVRGLAGVRVLQGLLALTKKHRPAALERACATAHAAASYRLKTVRKLLERPAAPAPAFAFMDKHPLIRELADYELWLRERLTRTEEA